MARTTNTRWMEPQYGEDFELIPPGTELPYTAERRGPIGPALILSVMALAALLIAARMFTSNQGAGFVLRILGPAVLATVGLGLLVVCWFLMRSGKLRITPDGVQFEPLDGVGTAWGEEPTSAYKGVLRSVKVTEEGDNDGTTVRYVLVLQHSSNPRKNVLLYSATSEHGLLLRQRHYAHLFNLPALIETEDGLERIAPEDLDKPLAERARTGVHGALPPAGPPPRNLAVRIEGDTVTMRTHRRALRASVVVGAVITAVGIWFSLGAWADLRRGGGAGDPDVVLGLAFGLIVLVVGLAVAAAGMIVVHVLRASPERIESWHEVAGRAFGRVSMNTRDAREVNVVPHGIHPLARALGLDGAVGGVACGPVVVISGRASTITFGHALSKEERRWVRECVLSVLAASGPEDAG